MKREKAIELFNILSDKDLIVKNLSSENYVKLIGLKRPLKKYIEQMAEDELELFRSYEGEVSIKDNKFEGGGKDFKEKLNEIQKNEFEPKELNFIEQEEFKKLTDDLSFNAGSTLAEYL